MKQKKRLRDGTEAELRLVISLDVNAEALGVGDGYLYVADKEKKKRQNEKNGGYTLSLRNAAEGACVCEISAPRDAAEWERLSQNDYFRYTDAAAADILARIKEKPGTDLVPHIEEITVETPLTTALRDGAEGSLREKAARMFPERQTMKIETVRNDNGIMLYELKKTDGYVAAPFRAGQSVRLFSADGKNFPAALCCSPALTKEGKYIVAIAAGDDPSSGCRAGDTVDVSAPEGIFFHTPLRDHRTVIGLTDAYGLPSFLSMAYALRDHLENFKLTVLLLFDSGNGEPPFTEEWSAICASCGKVHLLRLPAKEGIALDAIRERLPHEAYSVFICGAPDFCETAQAAIVPLGLPRRSVRCERR
ncbi:MAG: hypothetical protein IJK89_09275 [Clostridia bacterium]|nr:hypothetical protein [Clostridia bacterium]